MENHPQVPGSSPNSAYGHLAREELSSRPEFPEPAISSLLGAHAVCVCFFSPGGGLLSSSGSFLRQRSQWHRRPLLQILPIGLVGAPSLSLGVVCQLGNSVLKSPVGVGNGGVSKMDTKLEDLRQTCFLPLLISSQTSMQNNVAN